MSMFPQTIRRIKIIDLLTELRTIRDLTHSPKAFIINGDFEQGFTGWIVQNEENTKVIDNPTASGKVCHFLAGKTGGIVQNFPIAFDPQVATIRFYGRTTDKTIKLQISYYYTDGTGEYEELTCANNDAWELFTLAPDSAKTVFYFIISKWYSGSDWYVQKIHVELVDPPVIIEKAPTSLKAGEKTVASSATPEALGSAFLKRGVLVVAKPSNTARVSVGNSTEQKVELQPRDWVFIPISNLSKVYIEVAVNGEGVDYAGS